MEILKQRDFLNISINQDDLLPFNMQYPFVNYEQELVLRVISAITPLILIYYALQFALNIK